VIGKLFTETTEEEMERVIKVNLLGTMYLQKLVFPEMREHYGHIVNVSSLAGIAAGSQMSSYVASKFAVRGLTQAVQVELELIKANNVKLTCVMPHITKTGLFNNVQAKWPLFFPLLEPDWVAEQILIATQEERDQVVLPKMCLPFFFPEHLMSLRVWRAYSKLMGSHLMNTFVKIRPE
jgi:short-subunit dehydrogenase